MNWQLLIPLLVTTVIAIVGWFAAHALSSEHWKLALASGEEKEKLAELEATVPEGPESETVSGGVVSTVHVREAGEASVLPTASSART